ILVTQEHSREEIARAKAWRVPFDAFANCWAHAENDLADCFDLFLQRMIEFAQKRDRGRVGLGRFGFRSLLSWAGDGSALSFLILSDPGLDQLSHHGGREWLVDRKANGALAGVVFLKFVFVGGHRCRTHGVESAVAGSRAEGDEWTAIEAKRGEAVTD